MIMMRSGGPTKMGKPPPPVPPRPSKTIVQEALAKSRKPPINPSKPLIIPNRIAPLPPQELNKSKSCVSVNIQLKKPSPNFERSISEEPRPVVYQSANLKRKDSIPKQQEPEDFNTNEEKNWDKMLNDRNHVNTLIDEMFASVLSIPEKPEETASKITINNTVVLEPLTEEKLSPTVIIIKDNEPPPPYQTHNNNNNQSDTSDKSNSSTAERKKVQFTDDRKNHEFLIAELQNMKKDQEKILRRQRKPSMNIYEKVRGECDGCEEEQNWSSSNEDFNQMKMGSCTSLNSMDCKRFSKMSSLHGLPPLPKSLSGFNLLQQGEELQVPSQQQPPTPVRSSSIRSQNPAGYPIQKGPSAETTTPTGRKTTHLDAQLAILRREMYSLRQLDLSLLSQLWSLNESIQDFRVMLQDQDDRILSPPSPSPSPSSGDEGDGDEFYMSTSSISFRPAPPPPPPPARRPSSSSNASSAHER